MGQCQSLHKGPRRRGPQGKPWQDTESDLGDQIRGYGVKSVVTEQRYRPAQQGSPPIPVKQQNRLGDSGESMKTVRRHMSAGQKTKSDLRAEMPVQHRWGPVEHFVETKGGKGVWRRTTPQNYGEYEPRAPWTFEADSRPVYDIVPRPRAPWEADSRPVYDSVP